VGATLFRDHLETDGNRWNTTEPSATDAYGTFFDSEFTGTTSYASSGRRSLYMESAETVKGRPAGLETRRLQPGVRVMIPGGTTKTLLRFSHADWLVDADQAGQYDGARVGLAYDEGGTTRVDDAGAVGQDRATPVNGYNRTLAGKPGPAFGGDSHGWVSTRFDLSRFAGKAVTPTFDIVGDGQWRSAWWFDDVEIYTCTGPRPTEVRSLAATTTTDSATVTWWAPDFGSDTGVHHYEFTGPAGAAPLDPATRSQTLTGLPTTAATTVRVRAVSADGPGPERTLELVPTTTTVKASAATVAYGKPVKLIGTATRRDSGAALGGAAVTVQGRLAGQTAWTTIGSARTLADGTWSFTSVPKSNFQYQAFVTPTGGRLQSLARGLAVNVTPQVAASFRQSTIRRGQTASMPVTAVPARAAVVELQVRTTKGWTAVRRATTSSKGTTLLTVKPTSRGKFSYRVVSRADSRYLTGVSVTRVLTVR
jgi:hypothetical protein